MVEKTPLSKTILFFIVMIFVVVSGIGFAILHKEDLDNRIQFSLINHQGQYVSHETYKGQYLLVFFGFTHCPHICPTGMDRVTRIVRQLDTLGLEKRVTPLFVSVDPERDTPERLAYYLQSFHPRFQGLTGTGGAVQNAAESFKTFFKKQSSLSENYDVTHSSMVFLVDPYSRVVGTLSSDQEIPVAVTKIQEIIL